MLLKILKLKKFIGPNVVKYLTMSVVIGILWFLIESSFIFMIQGFLLSIGLLNISQVFLPDWYPTSLPVSIAILLLFGLVRALTIMLKNHIGFLNQAVFTGEQRINILTLSLDNARLVSTKEVLTLFSDVVTQSGYVISNLSLLINILCSMTLFFFYGLKIAPTEMLVGVTLLAAFLFPLRYFSRKISGLGSGLINEWENVTESLLLGLRNYFFLQIYNQVEKEIIKGKTGIEKYKNHMKSYSLIAGFSSVFPMFIGIIILSIITFISVKYIRTEPIKLISFFYLFIRFAQSAGDGSNTISNLKLYLPSIKKLYAWNEHLQNEKYVLRNKVLINDKKIEIDVHNLTFGFGHQQALFKDLTFSIGPSDVLVIKGESGSGKSTLLSLIFGLFIPRSGSVVINKISSMDNVFDLHKVLAYVGPDPYLIEGTIVENLLYGIEDKKDISEVDLWDALEAVELKSLIEDLKYKLNEPIHDIPQLSTGQKQRLSFARALLRKPSLLILDEATANLDALTEKKIISNLQSLFKNCTCVIVTHKNSFDDIATQEIVLSR